jgi:hypothetical protein
VSATANGGYAFSGFTGNLSGTTTPQSLTMNAPASVTANFNGTSNFTVSNPAMTVASGASSNTTVSIALLNGFNSPVTFTATVVPAGLTVSFSPATISGGWWSTNAQVTASGSLGGCTGGPCVIQFSASGGQVTHSGAIYVTISNGPNFTVNSSPSPVNMTSGSNSPATVSVAPVGTFSSQVTLVPASIPTGLTLSFSPAVINPGSWSTGATVAAAVNVSGSYTLGFSASGGGLTQTGTINVHVTGQSQGPSITSLSTTSGPVGTPVTISGTNFGTTQGTVTFNGTPATVASWGASSIATQVPAGASSGNVVVTVGGVASNGVNFTVTGPTDPFTVFKNCVETGNAPTCPLPIGTYPVSVPIIVGRSNVVICGADPNNFSICSANPDTNRPLLVRGQSLTRAIMELGRDVNGNTRTIPLTGVTIQNLTFCGGSVHRYDEGNTQHPNGDPNNACPITVVQTTCEADQEAGTGGCDAELYITHTGIGQSWANPPTPLSPTPPIPGANPALAPFSNTGPYNVTIKDCQFEDAPAPGHPIFIAPAGGDQGGDQIVNDVFVSHNVISAGGVQIGTYNTSTNWGDSTQCDNWSAVHGTEFADDTTLDQYGHHLVTLPRNIRFDNNTFWVNAGAVSGRGRYVQINNNTINGYYWSSGGGGGAIEQDWCSDQVMITGNTLNGNWEKGSTGPSGMELYSRNLTVSENTVSGFSNEGIGLLSVYNAMVTENHLWDNNRREEGNPEIKIATRFPWPGTCHPAYPALNIDGTPCDAYRDTQLITVQGNDSKSQPAGISQPPGKVQYGIFFDACCDGSTDNITGDLVSDNSLSVTGAQVACDPHVSANTCPPSVQIGGTPHTIAPFPEGSQPLGAPLGLGDPGATSPPSPNRRFFRFGANDPGGAGNFNGYYCVDPPQCTTYYYASIQGMFDTVVDPNSSTNLGVGGPFSTQAACRFAYFPVTNTIYLDDRSANFTFTGGSSPVGSLGGVLDNTICAINAGTSTHTTGQQYIELVLDITFHQTGTWFMYEIATNSQGNGSNSNSPLDPITHRPVSAWSLWGYWPVTFAQ